MPRSAGGGMIAGVCEGIAVRYNVDPTLVRVAFAATMFLGVGLPAYLACWLILPRYGQTDSPGTQGVKVAIALLILCAPLLRQHPEPVYLAGLMLLGVAVWGLYHRQPAGSAQRLDPGAPPRDSGPL